MKQQIQKFLERFPKTQRKNVLVGIVFCTLLVIFGAGYTGYSVVAKTIAFNDFVELELDNETIEDYTEQILEITQYDDMTGTYLRNVYDHRGNTYLYVFDGYVDNIFVFNDGELIAIGSSASPNLLRVEDF